MRYHRQCTGCLQYLLESADGTNCVNGSKLGHGHATCSNALYHEVTIAVPEGREFVLSVEEIIAVGGQVCDELCVGDRREVGPLCASWQDP